MDCNNKKTTIALKKANTIISKMINMIDDGEYCVDIMQQNLAAIGLLKAAHQNIMKNHLEICFKNGMNSSDKKLKQKMIDEVMSLNKASFKL